MGVKDLIEFIVMDVWGQKEMLLILLILWIIIIGVMLFGSIQIFP